MAVSSVTTRSITPSQTTSATSYNDATPASTPTTFDGQQLNQNETLQQIVNKGIAGEDQGQPSAADVGTDFAAGGLLINSVTGAVDGIDSSAQVAAASPAGNASSPSDSFSQRNFDLSKAQKLAALRAA